MRLPLKETPTATWRTTCWPPCPAWPHRTVCVAAWLGRGRPFWTCCACRCEKKSARAGGVERRRKNGNACIPSFFGGAPQHAAGRLPARPSSPHAAADRPPIHRMHRVRSSSSHAPSPPPSPSLASIPNLAVRGGNAQPADPAGAVAVGCRGCGSGVLAERRAAHGRDRGAGVPGDGAG